MLTIVNADTMDVPGLTAGAIVDLGATVANDSA
jgi:hypothetical protein